LTGAYREDLNWLVTDFTTRVADIAHAIVVSADGVPLALSAGIPAMAVEQFSAITSGLTSLIVGAARIMEAGVPLQALIEMDHGLMFVKAISDGSSLAVLAAPECDTRQVSYEMTRLVEAVGELLTPAIRAEVLAGVYRGAGVTLRPRASSFGNLITKGQSASGDRDNLPRLSAFTLRPRVSRLRFPRRERRAPESLVFHARNRLLSAAD